MNSALIKKGIIGAWYWTVGHIVGIRYDKRYLQGRYFQGKMKGLCAEGWKWVVNDYFSCKRMRVAKDIPWPVSPRIHIICPENIIFHPDDLNNFQGIGNYYQALGTISIGRGTYIAPNVGIITSNHDPDNLDRHLEAKPVSIGKACWIGINSVILPGVVLGDHTIVGAGSVVTKSFEAGHCIVAGNPAKVIREMKLTEPTEKEDEKGE